MSRVKAITFTVNHPEPGNESILSYTVHPDNRVTVANSSPTGLTHTFEADAPESKIVIQAMTMYLAMMIKVQPPIDAHPAPRTVGFLGN